MQLLFLEEFVNISRCDTTAILNYINYIYLLVAFRKKMANKFCVEQHMFSCIRNQNALLKNITFY